MRSTNWVGDAVMSLPALRALRERFPKAHIAVQARPWVADLYFRESFADRVIPYNASPGARDWSSKWNAARELSRDSFDCAILLPNSFDAALIVWLARIPSRIGYSRDARRILLTHAVPPPAAGEIPRHERYYYLELLRRAGILNALPPAEPILLDAVSAARQSGRRRFEELGLRGPVVGVSPGAAYGTAKRWLPERFAEAAGRVASQQGADVAVFGSAGERGVCEQVEAGIRYAGRRAINLAGATTLAGFIDLAAACELFLTNDSGAMHIASALGVPTVAVFGATDHETTGPSGPIVRVVREPVECSPCFLRECPIDHRCMIRVSAERVALEALDLLK